MPTEGLVTLRSSHTPIETRQRLLAEIKARGLTLFAHIDHAAGAAEVGQSLRPTEASLFGNARGGTPLMSANQTVGLDLPLKVLHLAGRRGVDLGRVQRSAMARQAL